MADPAIIDDDPASVVQEKEVIKTKTKKKTFWLLDDELALILAHKPYVNHKLIFSLELEDKLPKTIRELRATLAETAALFEKNQTSMNSEHAMIQAEYEAKGYATYQAEVTDEEEEIIQGDKVLDVDGGGTGLE